MGKQGGNAQCCNHCIRCNVIPASNESYSVFFNTTLYAERPGEVSKHTSCLNVSAPSIQSCRCVCVRVCTHEPALPYPLQCAWLIRYRSDASGVAETRVRARFGPSCGSHQRSCLCATVCFVRMLLPCKCAHICLSPCMILGDLSAARCSQICAPIPYL